MNYFDVLIFRKRFCYEHVQSNPLDLKWSLGVFRSISQTFGIKNDEKFVFWAWMQYFGVSNLRKSFVRNASNLLALDPKWCLEVFRSISQIFTMKNDGNFVLGMNAISQYQTSEKVSLGTHPIYSIGPKTMFGCVSEHFANLQNEKWCKTCVSGLNALFRGSELAK